MPTKKEYECETCHLIKPKSEIKRIGNELICCSCWRDRRDKKREHLKRDVLGIRKRTDLLAEWEAKREECDKLRKIVIPKINGSIIKEIKQKHYYLTSIEKYFLWKKYLEQGLDNEEIKIKIKNDVNYLNNFIDKQKDEPEENLNKKFKEEFSKMIMENGQ
jgi:hypothetical protein